MNGLEKQQVQFDRSFSNVKMKVGWSIASRSSDTHGVSEILPVNKTVNDKGVATTTLPGKTAEAAKPLLQDAAK